MATWTSFDDVVGRWVGSGQPTDEALVDALITDAETVILATYPRIQERIDDGALSVDVVKMVAARMVIRVLRNPEGLTYWQQNTGPFGQGRSFNDKDIWITAEEKSMLAPSGRGRAFSFETAPAIQDPTRTDTTWVEVN